MKPRLNRRAASNASSRLHLLYISRKGEEKRGRKRKKVHARLIWPSLLCDCLLALFVDPFSAVVNILPERKKKGKRRGMGSFPSIPVASHQRTRQRPLPEKGRRERKEGRRLRERVVPTVAAVTCPVSPIVKKEGRKKKKRGEKESGDDSSI